MDSKTNIPPNGTKILVRHRIMRTVKPRTVTVKDNGVVLGGYWFSWNDFFSVNEEIKNEE